MMATYFHGGSEIQAAAAAAGGGGGGGGGGGDQNLQTLYLMNPNLIAAYSEAQPPSNMLFLNHSNNFSQGNFPHAPPPAPSAQQQQQFVGIPLSGPHPTEDHGRPPPSPSSSGSIHHHHNNNNIPGALHGLSVSRVHPNLWSPVNNHPIRPASQPQSDPSPNTPSGPDMGDQMGFRRPMAAQGLSLSLSPGMQMQPQPNQSQVTVAGASTTNGNGVIPGSKYLKAAQELLEEVVNVGSNTSFITNNNNKPCTDTSNGNGNGSGTNLTGDASGAHKEKATVDQSEGFSHGGISVGGGGGGECSSGVSTMKPAELSTAQRQELQMKKAKLLNMLDEVEQRYRQYNTQMQVVVSSFEQAAGSGSAKLYTSLALKTISKQFRCLKDAIMSQIKATSNSLGEEDGNGNNTNTTVGVKLEGGAGSRLRFVDHQLRQQRALQQLGMMQHNAWRPQRGLPERAVSVLRAWLFEHFLHPYPKDSDKHMLAKQTGLTRSQVSNWFINARVRLWKPMVEEMYLEEIKTQEQNNTNNNNNNSEDNTTTINTSTMNKNTNASKPETSTTKEQVQAGPQDHGIQEEPQEQQQITNDMISNISATSSQGFTLIGSSSDMESLMGLRRSPKKQRSNSDIQNSSPSSILSMDMEMKAVDHHHHHQQQQQRQSFLINHRGGTEFNNPYIVNDEMGGRSFNPGYHGNAVSLTLGLPHGDNLSLGNHHQNFLPNHQAIPLARRLDNIGAAAADTDFCGISMAQPSHPNNNGFETIDIQNRKSFAAQILHDFVA